MNHSASDFSIEDERKAAIKEAAWAKWKDKSVSGVFKTFTKEEWNSLHADPRFLKEQEEWVVKMREDQKKISAAIRQYRPSSYPCSRIIFR